MTEPASDLIQLNQKLDAIVSSDDALQNALQSNDSILRAAARLTKNRHPVLSATARQSIWSNMLNAKPKIAAPKNIINANFVAWMGRIAAVFVIVVMASVVAQPVSADSLPGDALYPVKLGFENLQLAFANSPSTQVQVHLNHADERLREVRQLVPESALIEDTINSAINSLTRATTIASANAIFERDSHITEQAITVLTALEQTLQTNQVSDEFVAQAQNSLNPIAMTLPVDTMDNGEIAPEITPASIEVTAEATIEVIVVEVTQEPQEIIPPVQTTYYIHAESRVNVRSGAGTNFDIVGIATQNTPVTVISQNEAGDWIEVRLPNGVQGWIFNELLDNAPGQSSASGTANTNNTNNSHNANGNASGNANGNANGNAGNNATGNANGNANDNRNGNANRN